jgi:transcriptional regulator NrdR family protein
MVCPDCSGKLTVVDTVRDEDDVYRRRKCTVCGRLVFTLESEVEPNAAYRSNWLNCEYNSRRSKK